MTSGQKRPRPSVISLGAVRSSRAYQQLLTQLERFCENIPDDEPWSVDQFFGGDPSDAEMEVLQFAFLDWLVFDYRTWEDGRTVLERFAEKNPLDETASAMLKAWGDSRMGLYQVVAAMGDVSLLRDCLTGAEYPVHADPGIEPLSGDDLVLCRILPVGDQFHLSYDVRTTSAVPLPMVKNALEGELMRMRRPYPDATWDQLFKYRWPLVHDAITTAIALNAAPPLPQWHTPPSPGRKPEVTTALQEEVAGVIFAFMTQDDVSFVDRMRAQALWWDAAAVLKPQTGKVEAWAAGAVYAFYHYALADGTAQQEVADAFGISTSTLATRSRAIASALSLAELDDRYASPFDPRVRFRPMPEPAQTLAPSVLSPEPSAPASEATEQMLLSLPADDAVVLSMLGLSDLARGDKKSAKAYAERARKAYQTKQGEQGEGLLRLVELLAGIGDDEGILTVTHGVPLRELNSSILRLMAVAISRTGGKPGTALGLMELARELGESLNLVEPFISALALMEQKRIPVFKLDYHEKLDSLMGWVPKLNALTRSHLVSVILNGKAKDAVQAVRAVGAQRDPWAGRLLKHLYRQTDLPRTVQAAIERALNKWI